MARTTFEATALAVYLSLNVEVIDDRRGADLFTLPLLSLTWLVATAWSARMSLAGLRLETEKRLERGLTRLATTTWALLLAGHSLKSDLADRLALAAAMLGIGWRSMAWGLAG